MAFTEDFDAFLSTSDFGVSATVDGGDPVNAIFTYEWQEINIGQTPYSGELPTLVGKESDFTGKNGTTAVINGTSYTIRDVRPDGTGMATVVMTEQ